MTLGTALAAFLSRMTRAAMLETLREDFVTVARAKGLHPRVVLWKHAFRNALLPILTVLGLEFGALLGGAIVTEKVFAWPGMGTLLLTGDREARLQHRCAPRCSCSRCATWW